MATKTKAKKSAGKPAGDPASEETPLTPSQLKGLQNLRPGLPAGFYQDEKGKLRKMPQVVDPEDENASRLDRLAAMRFVLKYEASADRTPAQRACREWLDKNPAQFMEVYDRLEEKAAKPAASEVEKPMDDTTKGLIDRLRELTKELE